MVFYHMMNSIMSIPYPQLLLLHFLQKDFCNKCQILQEDDIELVGTCINIHLNPKNN
jgi:hypothetical protein